MERAESFAPTAQMDSGLEVKKCIKERALGIPRERRREKKPASTEHCRERNAAERATLGCC